MKRLASLLVLGFIVGSQCVVASTVNAAASKLSLSAPASAANATTFSVGVYEDSGGDAVNAARVTLSYPNDLLEYVGVNNSAAFSVVAASTGGNGAVAVERGALPAVKGRQQIASVRFKSKKANGKAQVAITGGNLVTTKNKDLLNGKFSTSVAVALSAESADAEDTTPPAITDLKTALVTYNNATITWKTSEPADSVVDYGPTTDYGVTSADNDFVTSHTVALNQGALKPRTTVHFIVKSTDKAGNVVSTEDMTFTTKEAPYAITLVNSNKKPVLGANITLAGKVFTSDNNGRVYFEGVSAGSHQVIVEYNGAKTPITVIVKAAGTQSDSDFQAATFTINTKKTNALAISSLVLVLLVLAAGVWMSRKKTGDMEVHKLASGGHVPKAKKKK